MKTDASMSDCELFRLAFKTLLRWGDAQFRKDVFDNAVACSDDSPLGVVRAAIHRLKGKQDS